MNKIVIVLVIMVVALAIGCDKVTKPEYNVENSTCNACGNCIDVCPNDAIEFDKNGKAIIDQTKCIQCAKCIPVCPQGAIY